VAFNKSERRRLTKLLRNGKLSLDQQLDCEALLAEIERELHDQTTLRKPERDPLYWSQIVAMPPSSCSCATIFRQPSGWSVPVPAHVCCRDLLTRRVRPLRARIRRRSRRNSVRSLSVSCGRRARSIAKGFPQP
jgi:hypothetical protein